MKDLQLTATLSLSREEVEEVLAKAILEKYPSYGTPTFRPKLKTIPCNDLFDRYPDTQEFSGYTVTLKPNEV